MLPVMRVVSPVRSFDDGGLALARWMSERYVAPLATVLDRLTPPRVAGEEHVGEDAEGPLAEVTAAPAPFRPPGGPPDHGPLATGYTRGAELLSAIGDGGTGVFVLRPAPEDEADVAVEAVEVCLHAGRRALVLVPEAAPLPATAEALRDAFGDRLCLFVGGDKRERYRRWLDMAGGRYDVVVGTRPAVLGPVRGLGLIYVSRESHPAHREDRSPYYHVRDVALQRARIGSAVCVLEALCPSGEAAALGLAEVSPSTRRWPKVEVVRPGAEGRAPRVVQALHTARRAFVLSPVPGYGLAQVCKRCGMPAACASCGGMLRQEGGEVRCVVCAALGRCAACGAGVFGIRRGGAERVEEWVRTVAPVPVVRPSTPRLPDRWGEIVVGGPEDVRDLGVGGLDLVAILDADRAARRPGLAARERAVAVWMEAVGWARPAGRAIVQATQPSDPAVQAVVRGNPDRFHERERERRAAAGFPVGAAVFRVIGDARLPEALTALETITSLVSTLGNRTVCLLALHPARVAAFGAAMRELAARGAVERVEAEPHL
jgi:primosomal protein N' (replication factor Y)